MKLPVVPFQFFLSRFVLLDGKIPRLLMDSTPAIQRTVFIGAEVLVRRVGQFFNKAIVEQVPAAGIFHVITPEGPANELDEFIRGHVANIGLYNLG